MLGLLFRMFLAQSFRVNNLMSQPNPDKLDPTIQGIQDKVKFLEQTIGKIVAHVPGSGETWFRWLDDVNRAIIDVPAATTFYPVIPSVLLTVSEIAL